MVSPILLQKTLRCPIQGVCEGMPMCAARGERTSLSDKKEEPDAPRQVNEQRHRIARVSQQIDDAEKGPVELALQPARLDSLGIEDRVRRRVVVLGGTADEGRREAPGEADHEESDYIVDYRRTVFRRWCCFGCHKSEWLGAERRRQQRSGSGGMTEVLAVSCVRRMVSMVTQRADWLLN